MIENKLCTSNSHHNGSFRMPDTETVINVIDVCMECSGKIINVEHYDPQESEEV